MDMFNNLLEILAPSPAPKEPVYNGVIEVGSEIVLRTVQGEIFDCLVTMPMNPPGTSRVRCKYLLAITDTQIVELYPHSTKMGVAVAAECHDLQALVKLKFKKGEDGVLLLEYKNGKISKLIMDNPGVCVDHIKNKMKEVGINGSVKNKTDRIVESAQSYFDQVKSIEKQFAFSPSVEYVQEMMDLLRRATEKFSEVNDSNYLEVMKFIRSFLQRPDVNNILEASVTPLKASRPTNAGAGATPVSVAPNTLRTEEITPSQLLTPTESQYSMKLPDIDAELSTLRNALTYQFEEDDHHDFHSRDATPKKPSAPESAEKCELTDMLDKMNLEFDSLLSSFEENSDSANTGLGKVEEEVSVININNGEYDNNGGPSEASEQTGDAAGFMEVDFDQTLNEIFNS